MVSASSHQNHAGSFEDDREYNVLLKMIMLRSDFYFKRDQIFRNRSNQNKLIDTNFGKSELETFLPAFTGHT